MAYKLIKDPNTIVRIEDGAFIPKDANNRDYADFLAWVAAGNVPAAYVPDTTKAPLSLDDVIAVLNTDSKLKALLDAAKAAKPIKG